MSPRFLSRLAVSRGVERGFWCRRAGKTLLELIVVLGIIAGMLGLFLPAVLMAWHALDQFR